jgi:tetratricopeptide (TPR) repeat protein
VPLEPISLEPKTQQSNVIAVTVLFIVAMICSLIFVAFCLKQYAELSVPVFATHRILAIHLIASCPFAWLLASKYRKRVPNFPLSFVLAAAASIAICNSLESIAWMANQLGVGFLTRCFLRCILTGLLLFGWFATWPLSLPWRSKNALAWTVLFWLVLPNVYASRQTKQLQDEYQMARSSMRLVRASNALNMLDELAGPKELSGVSVEELKSKIRSQIRQAQQAVAKSLPRDYGLDIALQRAMQLLSLSRNTEAEELLRNLNRNDSPVLVLRAIAARESNEFEKLEGFCQELITEGASSNAPQNPLAFQMLGEALVGQRKIREAIAFYERAIELFPTSRGDWEMRLGTLLREAGDPEKAIEHFSRAMQAEPSIRPEALRLIRGSKSNSCRL